MKRDLAKLLPILRKSRVAFRAEFTKSSERDPAYWLTVYEVDKTDDSDSPYYVVTRQWYWEYWRENNRTEGCRYSDKLNLQKTIDQIQYQLNHLCESWICVHMDGDEQLISSVIEPNSLQELREKRKLGAKW